MWHDVQGKRVVLPNTCIMLHHPSGGARGQASDLHNEARELMRLRNYINNVLAEATGQPLEKVSLTALLLPALPYFSRSVSLVDTQCTWEDAGWCFLKHNAEWLVSAGAI